MQTFVTIIIVNRNIYSSVSSNFFAFFGSWAVSPFPEPFHKHHGSGHPGTSQPPFQLRLQTCSALASVVVIELALWAPFTLAESAWAADTFSSGIRL
jgi:hypothetical protein